MFKQLNNPALSSYYPVFLAIFLLLILFATPVLAQQIEVGRMLMATVGVTAEQPDASPRAMMRRSAIYVGDTIKTPEGGRAQMRMADGEMLSLTAESELTIEAFEYQPDSPDAKKSNVKRLVTGGLRTITGAVKGDDYEMKSRAGTIGIRGTAFEVYTQQGQNLFIKVQSGNVFVLNKQGSIDIGVNRRFRAARIGNIDLPPEAIPGSELPKFFQDSFSEDADLSLAGNNNQENQPPMPTNLGFQPPAMPSSLFPVTRNIGMPNLERLDNTLPVDPAPVDPAPVDPAPVDPAPFEPLPPIEPPPPVITYSGFVVGGAFNASKSQALGGYFEKATVGEGTASSVSNSQVVFDFKQINNFNFNSSENWRKYVLGYADIVTGFRACTDCVNAEVNEQAFYQYVFATNTLSLDQLPSSGAFNYTLNNALLGANDFLTGGNLSVNFSQETIDATLKSGSLKWQGNGSLEAFYNSSIRLEAIHTGVLSDITGRFIGKNAEGAITTYKLIKDSDGVDYEIGTTIFEQP
ncbi:MAG TPA: FecR domain-containing protein [Marinospirillum sp.]|uniref:FecR family protein n=1 Tax=Marinospirillum sp. TaxID=2183934 RepID=UPI002B499CB7|nr:FecR domain-containing protein [Marinospirillum sp.]HKM15929.1 FecR domain-containing protein [Marinospirillum sp.]